MGFMFLGQGRRQMAPARPMGSKVQALEVCLSHVFWLVHMCVLSRHAA